MSSNFFEIFKTKFASNSITNFDKTVDKTTIINQKLFKNVTYKFLNRLINHRNQNDTFTNDLNLIKHIFHRSYWNDVCPVACRDNDNNNNYNNNNNYPETRKYWVDVQREIVSSHGERDPL